MLQLQFLLYSLAYMDLTVSFLKKVIFINANLRIIQKLQLFFIDYLKLTSRPLFLDF
ncbi:hypothetical protein GCM10022291_00410 [Postechiella marina]|uniref:Uncharacterized protein n=1 Tax=Postechiella marina TaxID=943941 RepID=A0ABP8BYK3_9FLAO